MLSRNYFIIVLIMVMLSCSSIASARFLESDPIGFEGGDVNLYRYVGNNPVNYVDPLGLETYQCTKPLDAVTKKFGSEVSEWAYKNVPYAYHQYSCVVFSNGALQCGGQDRAASPLWGPGKPSNDTFRPVSCKQSQPDNDCFERCLIDEWSKPRPQFGIPIGKDCQNYDDDVNKRCLKKCNSKK